MKKRTIATALCMGMLMSSTLVNANDSSKKMTPKIIGGYEAPHGRYPFMASTFTQGPEGDSHWCGGTLIAPRFVLTAAHCSSPQMIPMLKVVIGRTALGNDNQGYVRGIQAVHHHPKWLAFNYKYDIALLELDAPVNDIAPVSIVASGDRRYEQPGYWVRAAGWGVTQQEPVEIVPDRLQQVEVPVISAQTCNKLNPDFDEAIDLCAGQTDLGVCYGDSGGPLFVQEPATQRFFQIGATSRSLGDGPICMQYPAVFVRLSNPEIADFIAEIVRQRTGKTL